MKAEVLFTPFDGELNTIINMNGQVRLFFISGQGYVIGRLAISDNWDLSIYWAGNVLVDSTLDQFANQLKAYSVEIPDATTLGAKLKRFEIQLSDKVKCPYRLGHPICDPGNISDRTDYTCSRCILTIPKVDKEPAANAKDAANRAWFIKINNATPATKRDLLAWSWKE